MNKFSNLRLVIFLIMTVGWVGSANVRAQSRDDTHKRLFAARLSRREHISKTKSARSAERAHAAHQKVEAHQPARSAVDVIVAARRETGPNLGVSSATPFVPSGHGVGRDAFVESLYTEILGRDPSHSDLDFWTRALARGATTQNIARTIWNSREHRSLVRHHDAPNISLATAFRDAAAAARRARQQRRAARIH
jgi:hypothetical protein